MTGPRRDREWRLSYEKSKLCPDCYKAKLEAERQATNEQAAEENRKAGLPQLEGTEKQVLWAESIRKEALGYFQKIIDEADNTLVPPEVVELREKVFQNIKNQTSASWWIERRITNLVAAYDMLDREVRALQKAQTEPPAAIIEAAKAEATVYPENRITEIVAEIKMKDDVLTVSFPERREDFRQIVKGLGFSWSTIRWERKIYPKNGMIEDRAAEVGNKLLAAGFPIRIYDETIRQRAINGEYEPECKRWIQIRVSGEHEGWLVLSWEGYNDSLYRAAKKIAGARWSRPSIVVPVENYEEVLDFAQMYGFKISEKAQAAIDAARELKEKALTTGIKVSEIDKTPEPGAKPPVLEIPDEVTIDAELRDED